MAEDNFGFVPDEEENEFGFVPDEGEPMSKTESALYGAGQGLTFNFGDELVGGAQALMDNQMGSSASLIDNYKKHRDEFRKADEKAKKDNPWTYGAMEIVGGLPTAALVPAGALGKTATLGQKVLKGMDIGAKVGTIGGLGASKADNVADMVEDTAAGTGVGAGFGAVLPVAGAAVSGTVNKAKEMVPLFKNVINAYKFEKSGEKIYKNIEKLRSRAEGLSKDFLIGLDDIKNQLLKNKQNTLNEIKDKTFNASEKIQSFLEKIDNLPESSQAEKEAKQKLLDIAEDYLMGAPKTVRVTKKVPVGNSTAKLNEMLEIAKAKNPNNGLETAVNPTEIEGLQAGVLQKVDPETGEVVVKKAMPIYHPEEQYKDVIEKIKTRQDPKHELNPEEYNDLVQKIKDSSYKMQSNTQSEAKSLGRELGNILDEPLPENVKANRKDISDFQTAYEGITGFNPFDQNARADVNFPERIRKTTDTFEAMRNNPGKNNEFNSFVQGFTNPLQKDFKKIQGINQFNDEVMKHFEPKMKDTLDKLDLAKQISPDQATKHTEGGLKAIAGGISEAAGGAAAMAGRAQYETVKAIRDQLPENVLSQMEKLKSINPSDRTKVNAIKFQLMQNPAFRNYMKSYFGNEEEK